MEFRARRRWTWLVSWAVVIATFMVVSPLVFGDAAPGTLSYVFLAPVWLVGDGFRMQLTVADRAIAVAAWPGLSARTVRLAEIASVDLLDRVPWSWRVGPHSWRQRSKFITDWDRVLAFTLRDGGRMLVTVDDPVAALTAIQAEFERAPAARAPFWRYE